MADGNVAAEQLRLFIERIERLEEEKKGIADDIRDVYAEAKGQGYDSKTMRAVVRLRRMEKDARDEADALLETYRSALGLVLTAAERRRDASRYPSAISTRSWMVRRCSSTTASVSKRVISMGGPMAGHSKFKNIMYRKGAQDKKRSALFSKLSREITVAARNGLPDPAMNARLRAAVLAARAGGMPKDNIERSIKKAEGGDGENYEEIRYEGFGPGGVSLIVEALTDNRNRTATNVRTIVSKNGGNLGASGSVSHAFDRVGLINYPVSAGDAEKVFEAALDAGAEDVTSSEDGHEIWTALDSLHEVARALEPALGEPEGAKLAWRPQTSVTLEDEASASQLMKLIDALDDDDDVQTVWGNYEMPDEVMDRLA